MLIAGLIRGDRERTWLSLARPSSHPRWSAALLLSSQRGHPVGADRPAEDDRYRTLWLTPRAERGVDGAVQRRPLPLDAWSSHAAPAVAPLESGSLSETALLATREK